MSSRYAVRLDHVSKDYRLFGRGSQFQTLKSALLKREVKSAPDSLVHALRDVSFEIARGEAFGVIGRNGSGKSTLLKLISGILKPTRGRIVVDGRVSALIELGAGFHPEISGRENVIINGIMLGLTRREIERRFDRIVEFAGIGGYLEQPVKTYSSGMYVRLGFAVAVHVDPDILLIDEVLAVGDEEFSQKCIAKIQEMKFRGVTLLFVTHQLDHVRNLCDRALWLDHGTAESVGDPVRVVDQYLQEVSGTKPAPTGVETKLDAAEETASDEAVEEDRWGSGEVLLSRVTLLDENDEELVALGGRASVTIEMEVKVRQPQTDFVFGIGIYHIDGTCVYGTNTEIEGWAPEALDSDGVVRFVVPTLDLVAGAYRIDAAVHARNGRAFDYRRNVLRVVVGSRVHDVGIYRPPHEWEFRGGIRLRRTDDPMRSLPSQVAETMRQIDASRNESGDNRPPDPRRRNQ